MVYTRSEGTGCPYCTGRKVTPKQGGLVKQFPLLAAEWDVEKNTPLTPQDVTTGSHKLIWWRCPRGHSYRSAARKDGITCSCGSKSYGMEIHSTYVDLVCKSCGAKLRIPAATDEDLDRLCCRMKLQIKSE